MDPEYCLRCPHCVVDKEDIYRFKCECGHHMTGQVECDDHPVE
jgi:hypothetical protein